MKRIHKERKIKEEKRKKSRYSLWYRILNAINPYLFIIASLTVYILSNSLFNHYLDAELSLSL